MSYPFEGEEQESRALAWMKAELQKVQRRVTADGQREMAYELLSEFSDRLTVLEHDGPRQSDEWYDGLWDRFIFAASGTWPEEASETWDAPFEWREWEFESAQHINIGHSRHLIRTSIPKGGGPASHAYSRPPPSVEWHLSLIRQKDLTFLIGKAKVSEIDAVCSVPQLPAEIGSEEAGRRVLEPRRGEKEWQRRVDARRVLSIRNFIAGPGNIIANSVILYAPDHKAVKVGSKGKVTIDFSKFLKRERDEWRDHTQGKDRRPLWLIDGQHRTRGLAQSPDGIGLELPIILFPPTFSLAQSAKIFAEINTLQKKLSPLHTLFMQHRFSIPSPVAKRDFKKPWSPMKDKTWDSRANHLSYECAAVLASTSGGPLHNRIKILDQNAPRRPIIQATQWVDFSRAWFLEGGPYGPTSASETQEQINAEVGAFFQAFEETCNHGEWDDGLPRWSPIGRRKGLVQRQGPSQALLKLYPTAWEFGRKGAGGSLVDKEGFLKVLRPLKWVDWIDLRLVPIFGGSGERPRSALRIWMETAIRHGKQYPKDEIMSSKIKSQPGRGMLAPPGNSDLKIASSERWPTLGRPVTLESSQPYNTLPGSRWTIIDSDRKDRSPDNPTVFSRNGAAELKLQYEAWMDDVDYIDIRVDWYNTVAPPGNAEIRLTP